MTKRLSFAVFSIDVYMAVFVKLSLNLVEIERPKV